MNSISGFFTCGIGDFIAIESLLSQSEKENITKIYWGTRQHKLLSSFAKHCFPHLQSEEVIFDKFTKAHTDLFCFSSLEDMEEKTQIKIKDSAIIDYSVKIVFDQFDYGLRNYSYSSVVQKKFADIDSIDLPEKYICIQAYSDNVPAAFRDLSKQEWDVVLQYLESNNAIAVVIGKGHRLPPKHSSIIDLTNKTDVFQAIEVTKSSKMYIGSSSFASVVASKFLKSNRFTTKGNRFLKEPRLHRCYYHPLEKVRVFENITKETLLQMEPI